MATVCSLDGTPRSAAQVFLRGDSVGTAGGVTDGFTEGDRDWFIEDFLGRLFGELEDAGSVRCSLIIQTSDFFFHHALFLILLPLDRTSPQRKTRSMPV